MKEGITTSDSVTKSFIFRYRYTLALAHLARGERTKAHKLLSDLIGVDKSFAPAYVSLATSYLGLGKESVAEFVAKRGLDRIKDHPALLNLMGIIAQKGRQAPAGSSRRCDSRPAIRFSAMLSMRNRES